MMWSKSAAALVASLAAVTLRGGGGQEQPSVIDLRGMRHQVGKVATGCGRVVTHHCPSSSRTTFLDLDTPYWNPGVSIAVPATHRGAFGKRLEDRFALRDVCATGPVEREKRRFVITIAEPTDLRVEQEPAPP